MTCAIYRHKRWPELSTSYLLLICWWWRISYLWRSHAQRYLLLPRLAWEDRERLLIGGKGGVVSTGVAFLGKTCGQQLKREKFGEINGERLGGKRETERGARLGWAQCGLTGLLNLASLDWAGWQPNCGTIGFDFVHHLRSPDMHTCYLLWSSIHDGDYSFQKTEQKCFFFPTPG